MSQAFCQILKRVDGLFVSSCYDGFGIISVGLFGIQCNETATVEVGLWEGEKEVRSVSGMVRIQYRLS